MPFSELGSASLARIAATTGWAGACSTTGSASVGSALVGSAVAGSAFPPDGFASSAAAGCAASSSGVPADLSESAASLSGSASAAAGVSSSGGVTSSGTGAFGGVNAAVCVSLASANFVSAGGVSSLAAQAVHRAAARLRARRSRCRTASRRARPFRWPGSRRRTRSAARCRAARRGLRRPPMCPYPRWARLCRLQPGPPRSRPERSALSSAGASTVCSVLSGAAAGSSAV